jgi:hypothetical protein
MIGYSKDNFLYVCIFKNAYSTFSNLLKNNGWEYVDLQTTQIDLTKFKIWGHISHPIHRHTRGVAEFLHRNLEIDLDNDVLAKIIVFSMYDYHTSTINILLKNIGMDPNSVYWIPLDAGIDDYRTKGIIKPMTGNDLTNDFFSEHGIGLQVRDIDIKYETVKGSSKSKLQEKVAELKDKFKSQLIELPYQSLIEQDDEIYKKTVDFFTKKYNIKW